ncbi:MAG: ABC transporter ATP-binding protein [Christensenella sp.]|uniref:ABC transporter ATP-binding protein n=1 Tax=Christensenella sp. TaxID=1935934 RepID=UPI002B206E4A|nr:ABC transporter ATP-binding protein [Christensenella sp.]MEA5002976.1 ABC transporter ATP-binding protein [Christensenella sp.]
MDVLSVCNLEKHYPAFSLRDVSFTLAPGSITGFIGRNGAGKSTTLKSLLNFVHPDSGDIHFWGKTFSQDELNIKQRVGFVTGGIDYYPKKKLKVITEVTRRFFCEWDDTAYRKYMDLFALDEEKTPDQLSEGMKVKYPLALALSHRAELLILDEPTSGLDPVSRDDLLDIFMDLVEHENMSILFSTHITSDLEKCADNIIYIKNGGLIACEEMDTFLAGYKVAEFQKGMLLGNDKVKLIGCKRDRHGMSGLIKVSDLPIENAKVRDAILEDIMVHIEKEG